MPLSHYEVIVKSEKLLLAALVRKDDQMLRTLCHPNIVFINESGRASNGIEYLQIFNPEILIIDKIDVVQSDIHFFDALAVVSSLERRTGTYLGIPFNTEYHLTRVWKLVRIWRLVTSVTMMPC